MLRWVVEGPKGVKFLTEQLFQIGDLSLTALMFVKKFSHIQRLLKFIEQRKIKGRARGV